MNTKQRKRKPIPPEKVRFQLVLPKTLYKRLVMMAEQNHRSVTQQIITAIEWNCREINNEPTQSV